MRNQHQLKRLQSGFTLIELIIVIVIIGILAAVAIPKYIDLAGAAKQAAVDGMAGNIASAASSNYAIRSALGTGKGVPVTGCDTTSFGLLLQGGLPTGLTAGSASSATACTVVLNGVTSAAAFDIHVIP